MDIKPILKKFNLGGDSEFYLDSIAGQSTEIFGDKLTKNLLQDIAEIANLYSNRVSALKILDNTFAEYLKMRAKGSQLGTFTHLKELLQARKTKNYPMTEQHLKRTIDDYLLMIKTGEPVDTRHYIAEKLSDIQYKNGLTSKD